MPYILWRGWQNACEWITADLLPEMQPTGPLASSSFGFVIPLAGQDRLQVGWMWAYTARPEQAHFIRDVASLQAREDAFFRRRVSPAWSSRAGRSASLRGEVLSTISEK